MKIDKHGMTTVELGLLAYEEEPFVLARNVSQVFYVKDQADKDLHVALQGKRKIVGVQNAVNEEDYNHFDDLPPFGEDVDISLLEDDQEATYLRHDHDEAIIIRN